MLPRLCGDGRRHGWDDGERWRGVGRRHGWEYGAAVASLGQGVRAGGLGSLSLLEVSYFLLTRTFVIIGSNLSYLTKVDASSSSH